MLAACQHGALGGHPNTEYGRSREWLRPLVSRQAPVPALPFAYAVIHHMLSTLIAGLAAPPNASSGAVPRRGHCGSANLGTDCAKDEKGAWTLSRRETKSWSTAAAACTQRCQRCENCRFISFSVRYQDCSWFLRCSLPLRHEVRGFRSRPVNESIRYEEQCSSPAPYMRGGTACPT